MLACCGMSVDLKGLAVMACQTQSANGLDGDLGMKAIRMPTKTGPGSGFYCPVFRGLITNSTLTPRFRPLLRNSLPAEEPWVHRFGLLDCGGMFFENEGW
jgi:hypothetical protein